MQTRLSGFASFFLTRIIIGISGIGGIVYLVHQGITAILQKTSLAENSVNLAEAITDGLAALIVYRVLFRYLENRRITELGWNSFGINAIGGFTLGIWLQTMFILVLYLKGDYFIAQVNPPSFIWPGLSQAIAAGFVAEILLVGVLFRIVEEKWGTLAAFLALAILFGIAHSMIKGASFLSVMATIIYAAVLPGAVYVATRNLWTPIFLHFAWDLCEPGIFGGANPGISLSQTLFSPEIKGNILLTGGIFGPQSSISSIVLCTLTSLFFLWMAGKKGHFKPLVGSNSQHKML